MSAHPYTAGGATAALPPIESPNAGNVRAVVRHGLLVNVFMALVAIPDEHWKLLLLLGGLGDGRTSNIRCSWLNLGCLLDNVEATRTLTPEDMTRLKQLGRDTWERFREWQETNGWRLALRDAGGLTEDGRKVKNTFHLPVFDALADGLADARASSLWKKGKKEAALRRVLPDYLSELRAVPDAWQPTDGTRPGVARPNTARRKATPQRALTTLANVLERLPNDDARISAIQEFEAGWAKIRAKYIPASDPEPTAPKPARKYSIDPSTTYSSHVTSEALPVATDAPASIGVVESHHDAEIGVENKGVTDAEGVQTVPYANLGIPTVVETPGQISLEDMSTYTALPVEALEAAGFRYEVDARGRTQLAVAYFDEGGNYLRSKYRVTLGGEGTKYIHDGRTGVSIPLFGLDQLAVTEGRRLLIGEGETDAATAWFHRIAFVGANGCGNVDKIELRHVEKFSEVYLWCEPSSAKEAEDDGPNFGIDYDRDAGANFVRNGIERLKAVGYTGRVFMVLPPEGMKDLNDLHKRELDPALFNVALNRILDVDAVEMTGDEEGRAALAFS